jgi:thioredoxin-related protein
MKEWMDGYVNLYGELAITIALRDSLFTLAGKTAIDKARKGNPLVYGWMVDYFFNGYESFNIEKGIKMLQPYLDDPDCLTSKRLEINKRLKGIETLVPGTIASNITMPDAENRPFDLNSFKTEKKQILLLFWSADCSHCSETVGKLYTWYQDQEVKQTLDIVAISVDETRDEIQKWEKKIRELKGWTHLRAAEGLRSKVANDYYILGVPMMILMDAKTKKITALPDTAEQLNKLLIKN